MTRKPERIRGTALNLLLMACLALLSWMQLSCAAHSHPAPVRHPRAHGVRVVVAQGHVHSARCGHYRHRGHWYHLRGHAHGPRCGHAVVGGVWVLRR